MEGAPPAGHEGDRDDDEGVDISVQEPAAGNGREGGGGDEQAGAQQGEAEERRELVIANQTRLHPGEQTRP